MSLFDKDLVQSTPLQYILEEKFDQCCQKGISVCWGQGITYFESLKRSIGWQLYEGFEKWINYGDGRKYRMILIRKDIYFQRNLGVNGDDLIDHITITYSIDLHNKKTNQNETMRLEKSYPLNLS